MSIIILIVLLLLVFGAFPRAGAYNAEWGYGPSGLLGLVLVVILIFFLMGHRF